MELDEDPAFGSPTGERIEGDTYQYTFDSPGDGLRTVYVRARNAAGATIVCESIGVDMVAPRRPNSPEAPVEVSLVPEVTFSWPAVDDPQPASGLSFYEFQVGTAPGESDVFDGNIGDSPRLTVDGPVGQTIYARVRAVDLAGNIGEWSDSSAGVFIDTPPVVDALAVSPQQPRTFHDVTALFDASDADGDPVENLIEWQRSGTTQATGAVLPRDLTSKFETWECRATVEDIHGAIATEGVNFTIENTPPTQPIVQIVPRAPTPDDDLGVTSPFFSSDPDGDEIDFELRWFKSSDNGQTWIHQVLLNDSPDVTHALTADWELWQVRLITFEKSSGEPRVEAAAGVDQVMVGFTRPPDFQFQSIRGFPVAGDVKLEVSWSFGDRDGNTASVDLFWTDFQFTDLIPLATAIPADAEAFTTIAAIPTDRPVYLHAVIVDDWGAMTQVTSPALRFTASAHPLWPLYE